VGDFDPTATKELVKKYFGPLPPGPPVNRLSSWTPELDGVRRAVAEDNVNLPCLYYTWHTPALYASGDAELGLAAGILSSGKASRLYRSLVYEMQIAQDVSAYQASSELSSTFSIVVTAREGHTLAELEEAVDAELEKIRTQGVTPEELEQAQNVQETRFVRSLGRFGDRADRLNAYNVILGDPGQFQQDMERYTRATVDGVQQYVNQYLDPNKRAILHIIPQGELGVATTQVDRSSEPPPAAEPSFTPPTIQRAKLTNGLDVLVIEDHGLPLVHTNLVLKSGWAADPTQRPGATSLTAELLDEGTESRTALQVAEEVRRIGANMWTDSSFDGSFVSINVLKRNLDPALELISDMALNPTFPEEELERQRKLYLGDIQQEAKEPFTVARKVYSRILYGPGHPYGQPHTGSGTETSIKAITRTDLTNYYQANYLPNNAAIVMVGDVTLDEAREKLDKVFGAWEPGTAVLPEVPEPTPFTSTKICIVHKPGAAQSAFFLGNPGIRRSDPDYFACGVMNNVLGGQFTSRLMLNLREDKGYTYGIHSSFLVARGVGSFMCYAQVQTEVTREAIAETIKEMTDIIEPRPLTDTELADSKSNMIKRFPQRFQTYPGTASRLSDMVIYDLPDDEWYGYIGKVDAVDSAMVTQAARDHLHPDALLIVVVGDREKIETGIRELGLGEVCFVDTEGNQVPPV
ncbi:M16 family metallopeptidase, partial [Candidatus Poribacteria bacterium]